MLVGQRAGDISTSFGSGDDMLEDEDEGEEEEEDAARIFTCILQGASVSALWTRTRTGGSMTRGTYDTGNTFYDDMGRNGREERQGNERVSTTGCVANRGATGCKGLTRRDCRGHCWDLVQRRQRQRQRRRGWWRKRVRERRIRVGSVNTRKRPRLCVM